MAMWVKKNSTDWVDVKKIWVKKNNTTWTTVKKIWIKNGSSIWSQFWPSAGPYLEQELYLSSSNYTYPASGSNIPELTLLNYHWYFDTSLTLKYKWEVSSTPTGPWEAVSGYSIYQTYSPGNPSIGDYNFLDFTPELSDYFYGKTYFKFTMQATDPSGTSTTEVVSDPITIGAPIWYTNPSFTGTAAPTNTIKWSTGEARIQGSSIPVGYMTTIYRTNDNGATKQYLYGTSTTPDFKFSNNYEYSFALTTADIGYSYYASTYAIYSGVSAPRVGANPTATISGDKTVDGIPGAFSITSATKGKYNGSYRPLTVVWTTSEYAKSYEFEIDSSSDGTTWNSQLTFGPVNILAPTTSYTFNVSSNAAFIRVRARSTNSTGLYAYTTTVQAVGQAPTAPVITSVSTTTISATITFTPPTDSGSADQIIYGYSYRQTGEQAWTAYTYGASAPSTTITINNLISGTSYDFKIRATNFDQLVSPDSNVVTESTKVAPGPFTDVFAKSFDSGYITTFFTTGTNTSNVNVDYSYFNTQPPIFDGQNFDVPVSSSQKYYSTNTTALQYTSDQYNIALTASNAGGISTNYGNVFFVIPNGGDKPTSTTPTFSSLTGSGFTANFNLSGSISQVIVDLKTGGSSVSGYPKTLTASSGANSYAIPETLSRSTSYTFYVTPKYTDSTYTNFTYSGLQKSASVTTLYKFIMGDNIYVSTNGYVGLTSGSSVYNSVPSTGYNAIIYLADLVQYQTIGGDGSGLLYRWSNSTQYSVRWTGYLRTYQNTANYRVTYQINFYTNQNYYDVKFIYVGANVLSTDLQNANPGFYYNGSLVNNSIPGPYTLATGNTYRFYYSGALPTSGIAFTEITQGLMEDVGAVTNGTADDGYTSITTAADEGYPVPVAPTALSATTNSSSATTLTWSGGTASYYEFFYGSQNTTVPSTTADFGTDGAITSSPYDHAAPRGYDYYYFVRSVSGTTTSNVVSGWYPAAAPGIKGHRLLYPPPTPGTPTASGISATNITVSWSAGTNGTTNDTATSYEVYTSTSSTAPTSTTSGTEYASPKSFSYTASSSPTKQYFWVRGVNEGGKSAWSAVLEATPTAEYTITYDGNGSTSGSTSATTGNGTVTLRASGFTKTGYTFASWNTNATGTGTSYNASTSYTLSSNVTLYAKWTQDSTAPAAPTSVSAARNYTTSMTKNAAGTTKTQTWNAAIKITWTAPSPAPSSGYELFYNSTGTAPSAASAADFTTTSTSYDWQPSVNSLWYLWVRSSNGTGTANKSAWVAAGSVNFVEPATSFVIRMYRDGTTTYSTGVAAKSSWKTGSYAYTGVSTSFKHYPWATWTYGGTVVTATGGAV